MTARRLADVRLPFAPPLVVVMAVASFAVTLYRSRRFLFFSDEWDFIFEAQRWRFLDYFAAHNEHWSTLPRLYYRAVMQLFGVGSYVPYEAAVLAAHAVAGVLLFLVVRRRAGDLLGLLAAAMLLALGRGWEDLLWAFQVGFVGSAAFGLLALYLVELPAPGPWRLGAATVALLASLLCSGIGLFFLVLIGLELLPDPERRRSALVLLLPILVYAGWYVAFGRVGTAQDRLTLGGLASLDQYVPYGIGTAVAGLFGLSPNWSSVALAGLAAVFGVALGAGGLRDWRLLAAAGALAGQYALTGVGRARFGIDQAAASRYILIAGIFVLLLLAQAARRLPATAPVLGLVVLVALAGSLYNLRFLNAQIGAWDLAAAQQTAALQVVADLRGAPEMDRDVPFIPWRMPDVGAARYYDGVRRVGQIVPPASLEDVRSRQPQVYDDVLDVLFAHAIRVQGPGPGVTPCTPIDPTAGYLEVSVPSGGTVEVETAAAGAPLAVYLWSASGPAARPDASLSLPAGRTAIHFPDAGASVTWKARLSAPPYASVSVCSSGR